METKTFTNSFGRAVEMTRDEYIDTWLEQTWQYGCLFNTNEQRKALTKFQQSVKESAGDKWDKSK